MEKTAVFLFTYDYILFCVRTASFQLPSYNLDEDEF